MMSMEGFWIIVGLMFYLELNKTLLKILHLDPSSRILITYALIGFVVSALFIYLSYDKSSKNSIDLFILYVLGLSVQIGYWYFKKPRTKNFANK